MTESSSQVNEDSSINVHKQIRRAHRRRWWLRLLALVVLVAGLAWITYYVLVARWYETTENAYVNGNIVEITPRLTGTVVSIGADDNDFVERGQTLVTLDPVDAELALDEAEATLGQTVRKVAGLYSSVDTAAAEVAVRQSRVRQTREDFQRRRELAQRGAVAREELSHAEDAYLSAQSALAAAEASLVTARTQVSGTDIASHPDVQAAASRVREAWLDGQRTQIRAPVSGYVAKRSVQVGEHVATGTPLMAVIPLDHLWVDANFKETQLRHMRIGQPVELRADIYGRDVRYQGHVEGLGIGTGSAFSLLPAQNATGNWIKIVQRLPVRIALEPDALKTHPLRIGLSMHTRVHLRDASGATLATSRKLAPVLATDVYQVDTAAVEATIRTIIATNSRGMTASGMASDPDSADTE